MGYYEDMMEYDAGLEKRKKEKREKIKEALLEHLSNAYEFECVHNSDFGDIIDCPFYKFHEEYSCVGECNSREYFKLVLDKL